MIRREVRRRLCFPQIELDDDEVFGLFDPACRRREPPVGCVRPLGADPRHVAAQLPAAVESPLHQPAADPRPWYGVATPTSLIHSWGALSG